MNTVGENSECILYSFVSNSDPSFMSQLLNYLIYNLMYYTLKYSHSCWLVVIRLFDDPFVIESVADALFHCTDRSYVLLTKRVTVN